MIAIQGVLIAMFTGFLLVVGTFAIVSIITDIERKDSQNKNE